jgi:MFS family permease
VAIGLVGIAALYLYLRRSARQDDPVLDFGILRHGTFRASMVGGMPLRVAVGASPFLLPLLFQLGFGLSPLQSGLITMGTAVGSLATRAVLARTIHRFGFRRVLAGAAAVTSAFYAIYGLFTPATPHAAIFCALIVGGLCNSMALVSLSTLGFSEIPARRTGHATAMASMAQQLSVTLGVVLAAALVSATRLLHGGSPGHLSARDFPPTFFAIGAMTLLSFAAFRKLPEEIGDELRGERQSKRVSSRA